MWIDVRNIKVTLPSPSKNILVSDGKNVSIIKVSKFLDEVDKTYCQWKYWMAIPSPETETVEITKEQLSEAIDKSVRGLSEDLDGEFYTIYDKKKIINYLFV